MALRIAIVDDNPQVISIEKGAIETAFKTYKIDTDIDTFLSYHELEKALAKEDYNLFFLDIKTPDCDGIDFATKIRKANEKADIIFISSREERVFDTFKVQPFAFVRKSNFLTDITSTIDRYVTSKKNNPIDHIVSFKSHGIRTNESIKDIMYIEGRGAHQMVHFQSKDTIEISSKMEDLEKELTQYGFIRIHKGYLVNFFYINSIENTNELILQNGEHLPVSRRKLTQIKEDFMKLCDKYMVLTF